MKIEIGNLKIDGKDAVSVYVDLGSKMLNTKAYDAVDHAMKTGKAPNNWDMYGCGMRPDGTRFGFDVIPKSIDGGSILDILEWFVKILKEAEITL